MEVNSSIKPDGCEERVSEVMGRAFTITLKLRFYVSFCANCLEIDAS